MFNVITIVDKTEQRVDNMAVAYHQVEADLRVVAGT